MCDNKLPIAGMKPTVCDKPACIFSRETFGLGLNVASELQRNKHVSDLLCVGTLVCAGIFWSYTVVDLCSPTRLRISLFYDFAKTSGRLELFSPHAIVAKGPDGKEYTFSDSKGGIKTKLLHQVLDLLPSVDDMSAMAGTKGDGLRPALDALHPLACTL